MPVVVRIPFGGGIGAVEHHSESPESLFAHIPGLKVVACATPTDAHWMLRQAITCDDPVIFLEPKRRYWEKGAIDADPPPLHTARVLRRGTTAVLACYGPMVRTCLDAASAAEADGHDLEVVDLRTLSPLHLDPVFDAVRRTGRLIVVAEAPSSVSVAAEVAARVQEECFHSLEAPVLRVTGFDTPYPPSRCEDEYLPDLDRVLDAVDRAVAW
jgi:pyruvate dehydrogenase E1 component beta subunit